MINSTRLGTVLVMLANAMLAGCGLSSPSAPSTVSQTPTTLSSPLGMVALTTNRPDGATLEVKACPGEENPIPCSGELELTFLVVLNRDIERARVWTEFYDATGRLCGGASTPFVALKAGAAVTMTASSVYLHLRGGETSQCALPLQTTRMVSHLWDWAGPGDLLTQEFSKAYTFAIPQRS
jgi:hypothetical protein